MHQYEQLVGKRGCSKVEQVEKCVLPTGLLILMHVQHTIP